MANLLRYITKPRLLLPSVIIGVMLCAVTPVRAENKLSTTADSISPFDIDNSHWISFDHYKEKLARPQLKAPAPEAPPTAEETAAQASAAQEAADKVAAENAARISDAKKQEASRTPAPAAPERPLNLPIMPGLNKGFAVRVNSTVDDRPVAQITNIDTKPDVALPTNNWQNAAEAAKHNKSEADAGIRTSEETVDLHVRMSFLPDTGIKPVFHDRKPTRGKGSGALAELKNIKPTKSAEEKAACAAVDEYKKRQLEAIKGDRATLQALQDAIAQLGLQKELSFMAGAQGSVDTANIDIPVSPVPTTKQ